MNPGGSNVTINAKMQNATIDNSGASAYLIVGDIVQFVNADGSVHSLTKTMDQSTFEALSTIRGGEIADSSGI